MNRTVPTWRGLGSSVTVTRGTQYPGGTRPRVRTWTSVPCGGPTAPRPVRTSRAATSVAVWTALRTAVVAPGQTAGPRVSSYIIKRRSDRLLFRIHSFISCDIT